MRKKNLQTNIKNKAKRKLRKINTTLSTGSNRATKNDFLEKFMLCEVAIKSLIADYYAETGKKTKPEEIKLSLPTIKAALKFAGYSINQPNLEAVFGPSVKRNSKSCKKLRDAIVHSLQSEDIQEVASRSVSLNREMDTFLTLVS